MQNKRSLETWRASRNSLARAGTARSTDPLYQSLNFVIGFSFSVNEPDRLCHSPTRQSERTIAGKMLYIIGLGLADEKDISVKGLEIVRKAERVYLEAYTAILLVEKDQLVSQDHTPCRAMKTF